MVNLEAIYGDKLFSKKPHKSSKFIPIIADVMIDLITAYFIVEIFGIRQDYAFLKVLGVMYLFGFIIRPIVRWPFGKLNNKLFLSKAVTSEIDHYLRTFNTGLTYSNSGCYEDYLLEAAFNESLDCKMRTLAAMQYANFVTLISLVPIADRIYYNAWLKVVRKYL